MIDERSVHHWTLLSNCLTTGIDPYRGIEKLPACGGGLKAAAVRLLVEMSLVLSTIVGVTINVPSFSNAINIQDFVVYKNVLSIDGVINILISK